MPDLADTAVRELINTAQGRLERYEKARENTREQMAILSDQIEQEKRLIKELGALLSDEK